MAEHKIRRIVASIKQQHEIALMLNQFCSTNELGQAVYKEGWNDLAIAESINSRLESEVSLVTEAHVKGRRRQVYGELPSSKKADLETRVIALEGVVAHLEKMLETMAGARYIKYVPPTGRPRSTPPEG